MTGSRRAPDALTGERVVCFFGRLALVLVWWMPVVPFLWELFFPGHFQLLTAPAVGISDASRTEILLLALVALACSGWKPEVKALRVRHPALWLGMFLLWAVISSLRSPERWNSLFFSQGWLAAACLYIAVPRLCPARLSLGSRFCLLHLPVLSLCSLALSGDELRVSGPFQLPGVLANWLLLLAPLLFREYLQTRPKISALAAIPTGLAFLTLLLTVSRAAYLVLLFQIVCLLLLESGRSIRWFLGCGLFWGVSLPILAVSRGLFSGTGLIAAVAVVAAVPLVLVAVRRQLPVSMAVKTFALLVLVGAILGPASEMRKHEDQTSFVVHRWKDLAGSDNSAISRVEFWRTGLALAAKNPVLGVGPARYGESYPQVQTKYYYYSDSAHSAGIELSAELGFLGATFLMLAIFGELARLQLRPEAKPWQRGLLLGVVSGIIYAQFEVGYHFAYIWVSFAMVMALLVPRPIKSGRGSSWIVPTLALSLALAVSYPLPGQRQFDRSQRELTVAGAYREARQVANRYPFWSTPVLTALGYGFQSEVDPQELKPLVQSALRYASSTAVTYQFAGDLAYNLGQYSDAKAYYEEALRFDPFNYPGSYHGLFLVAGKTEDLALRQRIEEEVFRRYDLSLMKFAHTGHKDQLLIQLRPLLFDIADGLNPYRNPTKTEPLYRFLVQEQVGEDVRALHGLGVSLWAQGRRVEAKPFLERAHELNEYFPLLP